VFDQQLAVPATDGLNPNGISIGSAVFAQLTAERSHTLQWAALSPLKIALSPGDLDSYLIHGRSEFSTQTASRSGQPLLRGSLL